MIVAVADFRGAAWGSSAWADQGAQEAWRAASHLLRKSSRVSFLQIALAWAFVAQAAVWFFSVHGTWWRPTWAVLLLATVLAVITRTFMVLRAKSDAVPLAFRVLWAVHPVRALAKASRHS